MRKFAQRVKKIKINRVLFLVLSDFSKKAGKTDSLSKSFCILSLCEKILSFEKTQIKFGYLLTYSYLCGINGRIFMTQEEKVRYWLNIADYDLDTAEAMHQTRRWLYVGFMCHQVIEKTLKAYWCACREDDPPYLHDHGRIAKGCGLYTKMSDEQKDFLEGIKQMNIEARYQEYKDDIARTLNGDTTAAIIEQTKQFHAWILEKLKEKS